MAFRIPNEAAAPFIDQAKVDAVDTDILVGGYALYGVASGLTVTENSGGADMSVDVAAGVSVHAGVVVTATNPGNFAIDAADATQSRFDLIVVDVVGTISVVKGTNSSTVFSAGNTNAIFPTYTGTSVVLAAVYVPGAATSITTASHIQDRRVFLDASMYDHGSLAGLTDDDHTQYFLLAGRSGGQTAIGGTGSGDDLLFESTSHATKGIIALGPTVGDHQVAVNSQVVSATINGTLTQFTFMVHNDDTNRRALGLQAHIDNPTLTFLQSRGTPGAETVSQDGNALGVINFLGHDGTDYTFGAQILAFVDGTPGNNDMPGRLVFRTTLDGASTSTERMRITNAGGIWMANYLRVGASSAPTNITDGDITGTRLIIPNDTIVHSAVVQLGGPVVIPSAGALRWSDSDNSHYTAFKAADTTTATVTYTLPPADGSDGQQLTTDGAGVLTWEDAGGGGGAALEVREEDGSPSDTAVTIIRVPNGTLIDNGAGDVSLTYPHGAVTTSSLKVSVPFNARNGIRPQTSPARFNQVEAPTNDVNWPVIEFIDGSTTYWEWELALPDNYDASVDLNIIVRWFINLADNTKAVRWGAQAVCFAPGDSYDTAWGTAVEANGTVDATANDLIETTLSSVAPANDGAGRKLKLRVYREGGDAGDTAAAVARLSDIRVEYSVTALSS